MISSRSMLSHATLLLFVMASSFLVFHSTKADQPKQDPAQSQGPSNSQDAAHAQEPGHPGADSTAARETDVNKPVPDDGAPLDADRLFTLKIMPMLTEKCLGCHGGDPDDLQGDYDVRTRDELLRGGESETAAIVPGKPDESPFYEAVTWAGLEMPPKENDRLTPEQTKLVRQWIEAGAPWPNKEKQAAYLEAERMVQENDEGVLISTSGGLADDWTYRRYKKDAIWAFLPVQSDFRHDNVDGFINEQISDAGIEPAKIAEPVQLLKRAYYDLTGLPPSPVEQKQFLDAWDADADTAWNELIDRLLDSPHYGERWAQHWLDVVRYADTGGLSNDYERSNSWRYRDYVIRSFNKDKPFDEFAIEQIAGDELYQEWAKETGKEDSIRKAEATIATGFLRMGPWDTAMIPQDEARQLFRDDAVHSIGQSFLSMPMRCCKCHDHKFDPIPTRDYYRIYATVSATQPAEMPADFLPEENLNGMEEGKQFVDGLHKYADERAKALQQKVEDSAREWYAENDKPYKKLNERKGDPDDEKPPRHAGLSEMEKGQLKVREQDVWIWNRRKERYQPMAQSVFNGPNQWQNAKSLRQPKQVDMKRRIESFIFMGGSYQAPGEPVTPGVLSGCGLAVPGAPTDDPYALPTTIEGRRLALARWIAHPENPLTARSMVNRVWQYHFGQGLVATPNNFGVKGSAPSHPELLDWLTREFIDGGWTLKRMHRMLMKSDAYRRSTQHEHLDRLETVDPDNRLFARALPRRLTAEEVRDSLLAVTGELNREVGGFPSMPEINMEVALEPRMIQFSLAPAYQPSPKREQRNRRSIYAYRVRGQADPFLEVLNKPNPNDSCDLRDDAAVSPQAFTLLNSDAMSDRSIAMATRIQKQNDKLATQINQAFRLTLGRKPTKDERKRLVAYVQEMVSYHESNAPEAKDYPTEITRSLVEEFSGQPFEYTEWLPAFENYEADLKAWDVDAKTRSLADLCLLLFNSNEFVYLY